MSSPIALLAIADPNLRKRIGCTLTGLRWQVFEMSGGAETLSHLEAEASRSPVSEQAVILDESLPDLDIAEFLQDVQFCYPQVGLLSVDGSLRSRFAPSLSRRGELMHAIRSGLDGHHHLSILDEDEDAGNLGQISNVEHSGGNTKSLQTCLSKADCSSPVRDFSSVALGWHPPSAKNTITDVSSQLPELVGRHSTILEVSRRICLVATRRTPVLIQGPTGTGKELVARATHRLSQRCARPFIVVNCAAIPESLLEAELFGHTRGAFTGAIHRRVGRIEAAHGGTLFLDEIGELPISLQAKLLRFLESGEIQRIGDNETHFVDVRIIAATHQRLAARSRQGTFREDLFHRLAVFTIRTPSLLQHAEDIPLLANLFLLRLCEGDLQKELDQEAMGLLIRYQWPGNVRELAHVLERAIILSEGKALISSSDIEFDSDDA